MGRIEKFEVGVIYQNRKSKSLYKMDKDGDFLLKRTIRYEWDFNHWDFKWSPHSMEVVVLSDFIVYSPVLAAMED